MGGFSLDAAANQFYTAALNYSTAIQPYALKLFFALFLIELLVTYIQYTADGAIDPISYFGRMVRQLLGAGFVLAMLTYGFQWMTLVIKSFGQLGRIITGIPPLSPDSIASAGIRMATMLWNNPGTSGIVSSLEMAIIEALLAGVVLAAFVFVALELLLTLVRAYFTVGLGVILLSFGGNRFTANAAEVYFTNILRVGVKILFMYGVLAVAMQLAGSWEAALLAVCHPTTTAVPWMSSYFTPPSSIMTKVCTGKITLADMANYAVEAVAFAALCVGVPRMAADLVGGALGHALEDVAAAGFIARSVARTIVSPIVGGVSRAVTKGVREAAAGASEMSARRRVPESAMQSFVADAAAQARARSAGQSTKVLNPFNGQQPGYNLRPTQNVAQSPSTSPMPTNGKTTTKM
jgi:type IV secretion system protein TrbL